MSIKMVADTLQENFQPETVSTAAAEFATAAEIEEATAQALLDGQIEIKKPLNPIVVIALVAGVGLLAFGKKLFKK